MHDMNDSSEQLQELRTQIDSVDAQLVALLNKRAELAVTVGNIKASTGQKVYDPSREGDVISKIDALNDGPLSKGAIEEIYGAIITACREIQMR